MLAFHWRGKSDGALLGRLAHFMQSDAGTSLVLIASRETKQ